MKNRRDRFDRAGTYICSECGKRTRNVDGEASVGLCKKCYEEMENENWEADTKGSEMINTMEKKHREENQKYFRAVSDEKLSELIDDLNSMAMTAETDVQLGNASIMMLDILHEVVMRGLVLNKPYIYH